MAFYTRKKGIDLWRSCAEFKEYDFCLCCKAEISPGERGLESIKPETHIDNDTGKKYYTRRKLCELCLKEWEGDCTVAIMNLKRFKIQ